MADRTVVTRLMLDPRGYLGGIKTASAATRDFASEFDKAAVKGGKNFDQLAHGSAIAGAGILAGFAVAAHAAMDFDKAMSGVVANGGEYVAVQKQLRQAALDAGQATAYSATQAANAETELAKAGVHAQDILGGGLTGALSLAAAGQLDVGKAAEIAATAMTEFHVKGSQVPHVADLLSAAANKAQGSVEDIGMALKQGGLVASQFGLSIEETTGSLAAFASEGLIGSDAGTSLKTMLLALANPAPKTAKLMEDMGIKAYDAGGKFVGLAGLAGNLRQSLAGLTQQQRDHALAQIFGNDAVRAANVLYRNGADGIKEWTTKVNDAGNASRTAATKMDNLSGDVERLRGSIDTGLIKAGSSATGTFRLLTKAADGAVQDLTNMPPALGDTASALGVTAGLALTAAGAYGTLAPKIREARAALTGMGPAGEKVNSALGTVTKTAGIAAAVFAGYEVVSAFGDQFRQAAPNVDALTASLAEFAATGKAGGELGRIFGGGDLDKLKAAIEIQRSALAHPTAAKVGSFISSPLDHWMDNSNNNLIAKLKAWDAALASMQSSGHAKAAADLVAQMGISGKEVAGILPTYSGALDKAASSSDAAGQSAETQAAKQQTLAQTLSDVAAKANGLKDAYDQLNGVNVTFNEKTIAANQALKAFRDGVKDNGHALNLTTKAGQANIQNLDAIAQKAAEAAQAAADKSGPAAGVAAWNGYVAALRRTMTQAHFTKAQIDGILHSIFQMPPMRAPAISAPGAKKAGGEVGELNAQIKAVKDKLAKVNVVGPVAANSEIAHLRAQLAALQDKAIHLQVTTTYAYHGPQPSLGLPHNSLGSNIDKSRWGNVYSFAAGGVQAKVAGPGTLYQWAEPSTGGEAFIPRNGDKARSASILDTAASWYGMKVSPMAAGGLSFAAGGTTVPISDYLSRYTPSSFSTSADVTAAARARANAVDTLRTAEGRLADDRRRKHVTAAKLAADEASISKARRQLTADTEKLAKVQVSYQASKVSTVDRFRSAVALGVTHTGNFLANLQKLSDRGFRDLAMQLLNMGGTEAESIASGAVKLTSAQLKGTAWRLSVAENQQQQLQFFGQISGARAAVKKGNASFEGIEAATGSSGDDLATALKLIATELGKSSTGRALLADMHDHGYADADGGIAPPGTRYRYAEPSTGGEALIPMAGSKRGTATGVLGTVAGRFGYQLVPAGGGGGGGPGAAPVIQAQVRVFVGDREITDIARTEVSTQLRTAGRQIGYGRR